MDWSWQAPSNLISFVKCAVVSRFLDWFREENDGYIKWMSFKHLIFWNNIHFPYNVCPHTDDWKSCETGWKKCKLGRPPVVKLESLFALFKSHRENKRPSFPKHAGTLSFLFSSSIRNSFWHILLFVWINFTAFAEFIHFSCWFNSLAVLPLSLFPFLLSFSSCSWGLLPPRNEMNESSTWSKFLRKRLSIKRSGQCCWQGVAEKLIRLFQVSIMANYWPSATFSVKDCVLQGRWYLCSLNYKSYRPIEMTATLISFWRMGWEGERKSSFHTESVKLVFLFISRAEGCVIARFQTCSVGISENSGKYWWTFVKIFIWLTRNITDLKFEKDPKFHFSTIQSRKSNFFSAKTHPSVHFYSRLVKFGFRC